MKQLVLATIAILLTGCGFLPVQEKIIQVDRPILYCPAPKWELAKSPYPLAVDGITKDMSAGEVAKRYNASIIQLRDYSQRLELMLEQYQVTHDAYEVLRNEFVNDSVSRP